MFVKDLPPRVLSTIFAQFGELRRENPSSGVRSSDGKALKRYNVQLTAVWAQVQVSHSVALFLLRGSAPPHSPVDWAWVFGLLDTIESLPNDDLRTF